MAALPALDPAAAALRVTLEMAPAFPDLPTVTRALLDLQRHIQRSLAHELRAVGESGSALRLLLLMSIAFAFGSVQALTPGRGKSVVASYRGLGKAPSRTVIAPSAIATGW